MRRSCKARLKKNDIQDYDLRGEGGMIWETSVATYTHAAAAAAKSLQSCLTLCDPHRQQPTRLLCSWDSPGKNTGVGCHFLLQCMKVKSGSEVSQSCPTLSEPIDCSPPGSSVHGIFQARVLEWGAIAFSFWDFVKYPEFKFMSLNGRVPVNVQIICLIYHMILELLLS